MLWSGAKPRPADDKTTDEGFRRGPPSFISFFSSLTKYSLNAYDVPFTVLGAGTSETHKLRRVLQDFIRGPLEERRIHYSHIKGRSGLKFEQEFT